MGWNKLETCAIEQLFKRALVELSPPSIYEIREKIRGNTALEARGDRIVREKVINMIKRKKNENKI